MADEESNGQSGWNPQDDAIAAGEHIPETTLELSGQPGEGGAPHPSPQLAAPSSLMNPYLSEEDQYMEMEAQVVGPPQYGSPDPVTSASRLVPLSTHPLNAEALPEDHPAAISEDYGEGYATVVVGGVPQRSDLENDLMGSGEEVNYDEMTKAELQAEAESRGLDVPSGANKADIVAALEADDGEATQ